MAQFPSWDKRVFLSSSPALSSPCQGGYCSVTQKVMKYSRKGIISRFRLFLLCQLCDFYRSSSMSNSNIFIFLFKIRIDGKEYEIEVLYLVFQSENLENTVIIPDIKLHSNPSAFNIYCNVRHCVLEWQKKETSLAAASKNSVQSGESDSDEEEESKEPPIKLPKVSH